MLYCKVQGEKSIVVCFRFFLNQVEYIWWLRYKQFVVAACMKRYFVRDIKFVLGKYAKSRYYWLYIEYIQLAESKI